MTRCKINAEELQTPNYVALICGGIAFQCFSAFQLVFLFFLGVAENWRSDTIWHGSLIAWKNFAAFLRISDVTIAT